MNHQSMKCRVFDQSEASPISHTMENQLLKKIIVRMIDA